jgi:tetratricopeptide (TPR) repeat protein
MAGVTGNVVLDPEQELGLVAEAFARGDRDAIVAHLAAAIRGFTATGDARQAALAAAQLGDVYANWIGNATAARAWFNRADRLVADEPPCVEQGWVAVAAMGCEVDDPDVLLARAERALALARRFGDLSLETKALADAGLAHVQAGRVDEGFRLLDEAMALACTADATKATAQSVCSFFTACYYAADFARAGTWATALRDHGIIGAAPPGPAFLSAHCDAVQAALLREVGRWGEAEALLERAMADFEAAMGQPSWHPAIELADLRVSQGRLTDAEALLLGKDGSIQALLPSARLHLARGDAELAAATARRGLRAVGSDRLRAVELLGVLVRAALALGDRVAAEEAAADLARRASGLELPGLAARAATAQARVLAAAGDGRGAVDLLLDAGDRLLGADAPWCRAVVHLELCRVLDALGDAPAAVVEARAAAELLAPLDVVVRPDDQALLDRVLGTSDEVRSRGQVTLATLSRAGNGWTATHAGHVARLPDTKGLAYVAALVAQPGVERHALDLVDLVEGVAPADEGLDRRRLGDAGPMLDSSARAAYRRRVEALRAEADEAIDRGDDEVAMARQDELDALVAELARAYGLGGRGRSAASAAERARLNVTRALRAATKRMAEVLPEAGAALDRRVRTGAYCAYQPQADDQVRWRAG